MRKCSWTRFLQRVSPNEAHEGWCQVESSSPPWQTRGNGSNHHADRDLNEILVHHNAHIKSFSSIPHHSILVTTFPANPLTSSHLYNTVKMGKRSSSFVVSDNSSGDERPAKTSKKAKKETKTGSSSKNGTNVDSEGNAFWDVGSLVLRYLKWI